MHDFRMIMAAHIASGLIAVHGIDHGGVDPSVVAGKSLAIADAIIAAAISDGGDVAAEEPEPSKPADPPVDPGTAA